MNTNAKRFIITAALVAASSATAAVLPTQASSMGNRHGGTRCCDRVAR